MSAGDSEFTGSIPEIYDNYLVPLIFDDYAHDLARRVSGTGAKDLLEIAAGSGVVTRAIAPLLPPDANYVVTDLNQPMLDHAAKMQKPDDRILWRQADAMNLPFDTASFGVVFCQFGVMFFSEKQKAYGRVHHILKPGGSFIFNVWDKIEENELVNIVNAQVVRIFPQDPPMFMRRAPHGYYDKAKIRDDLKKAGFGEISITTVEKVSRAPNAHDVATAYLMGSPWRDEIEARGANMLEQVVEQARQAIVTRFGSGPIEAKIQAHIINAVY